MTAYGTLQMEDSIWRRSGGVTIHPVSYAGSWLHVLEPLEGSFLIATKTGLVVIERLDASAAIAPVVNMVAGAGADKIALATELGRLVQLIEDEFTDADDLQRRYLEHEPFPVQLAQLSTLAAGEDQAAARGYLADLLWHLEGGGR